MIRIVCQKAQFLGMINNMGKESGAMTKSTKIFILLAAGVLTLMAFVPLSKNACANNAIAAQTCDSGVWATMATRARMETEREIMQNQNLIFKPDSILSYVCFDAFAGHAQQNVGNLFTHTNYRSWGLQRGGNTGMDTAMNNVVINSMNSYEGSNFNHSLLGGRGGELGMDANRPQVRSNLNSYGCDVMAQVWQRAKCMNFMHTDRFSETDGFYPFLDLTGIAAANVAGYQSVGDARAYPANMACGNGANAVPDGWVNSYNRSRNRFPAEDSYYPYYVPNRTTYTTVYNLTRPDTCGAPIPTGIQIMLSPSAGNQDMYADGVCTNPGCSYIRAGAEGECRAATGG